MLNSRDTLVLETLVAHKELSLPQLCKITAMRETQVRYALIKLHKEELAHIKQWVKSKAYGNRVVPLFAHGQGFDAPHPSGTPVFGFELRLQADEVRREGVKQLSDAMRNWTPTNEPQGE